MAQTEEDSIEDRIKKLQAELDLSRQREHEERQLKLQALQDGAAARQREAEARRDVEQLEQRSTLYEYLQYCQMFMGNELHVQEVKSLATQGEMTRVTGKLRPSCLKPWHDLIELQRERLGLVNEILPFHGPRLFERIQSIRDMGLRLSQTLLSSEKDLEIFLHTATQYPVYHILQTLHARGGAAQLELGGGRVKFVNHSQAMSDDWTGELSASTPEATQLPGDNASSKPERLNADSILIYSVDENDSKLRIPIFVMEYKAAHKISREQFRVCLSGEFNLDDFLSDPHLPDRDNHEACARYHARKLVAAAATQTYDYMVQAGLEYGLLTTGEVYVFLRADRDEAGIVYYHLAEPDKEFEAQDAEQQGYCTAVSQVLAFCLVAVRSRPLPNSSRTAMASRLKRWGENEDEILLRIPEPERRLPDSSDPAYPSPRTYKELDRSPYLTRNRGVRAITPSPPAETEGRRDDSSPSPSPQASPSLHAQQRSSRRPKRLRSDTDTGATDSKSSTRPRNARERPYCTQACMLGVQNRTALDLSCPNVSEHCNTDPHTRQQMSHAVDAPRLREALIQQFTRTGLDDDFIELYQRGATGALFKVISKDYGYTFVAKAVVSKYVPRLEREEHIYAQLQPLQGRHTPVCLGFIELPVQYMYGPGVRLKFALLLSWSGNGISRDPATSELAITTRKELKSLGVRHGDWEERNLLYCAETNTCIAIDFERSSLISPPAHSQIRRLQSKPPKRRFSGDGAKPSIDGQKRPKSRLVHGPGITT